MLQHTREMQFLATAKCSLRLFSSGLSPVLQILGHTPVSSCKRSRRLTRHDRAPRACRRRGLPRIVGPARPAANIGDERFAGGRVGLGQCVVGFRPPPPLSRTTDWPAACDGELVKYTKLPSCQSSMSTSSPIHVVVEPLVHYGRSRLGPWLFTLMLAIERVSSAEPDREEMPEVTKARTKNVRPRSQLYSKTGLPVAGSVGWSGV